MTTPLFFVRIVIGSKEEKSGPTRQGQKVGFYDDEEPHSCSCSDSDDLPWQPGGCEGKSSRFGKQHHRGHRYSQRCGQVRGCGAKVHIRQYGGRPKLCQTASSSGFESGCGHRLQRRAPERGRVFFLRGGET